MKGIRLAGSKAVTPGVTSVAASIAPGSLLAGGFGLMTGNPLFALASAGLDFGVNYGLVKGARALRPPKTPSAAEATNFVKDASGQLVPAPQYSRLENAANIGGNILSAGIGLNLLPEPTVMSQDQTIMHEMMQRQAVNNLQVPQAVSPGTQFQMSGLEFLNQYVRPDLRTTDLNMPMPARVQALLQQTGMELL